MNVGKYFKNLYFDVENKKRVESIQISKGVFDSFFMLKPHKGRDPPIQSFLNKKIDWRNGKWLSCQ